MSGLLHNYENKRYGVTNIFMVNELLSSKQYVKKTGKKKLGVFYKRNSIVNYPNQDKPESKRMEN